MYDLEDILAFRFKHEKQNKMWQEEARKSWALIIGELEPFFERPYHDDANTLRGLMAEGATYMSRLSMRRAKLETFYRVAQFQRLAEYASKVGSKADMAKRKADNDVSKIKLLLLMAERAFESLKEAKGTCQSLLAMEREGMPRGALYLTQAMKQAAGNQPLLDDPAIPSRGFGS